MVCVSWLPLGFTWPLEHYSCSLQNADRAGKGSVMGPGADLFLNLLTKCLLKPCQSSASVAQKPLQTTMKDLLFSQSPQTRTNHLKPPIAALSESVMLQNCSTSMTLLEKSCLVWEQHFVCHWIYQRTAFASCLLPLVPIPFSKLGTTTCVTFPQKQQSETPFLGQDSPQATSNSLSKMSQLPWKQSTDITLPLPWCCDTGERPVSLLIT